MKFRTIWINEKEYFITYLCFLLLGPSHNIKTLTSDVQYAGTGGEVSIDLTGSDGLAQQIELDNDKDNFERKL